MKGMRGRSKTWPGIDGWPFGGPGRNRVLVDETVKLLCSKINPAAGRICADCFSGGDMSDA